MYEVRSHYAFNDLPHLNAVGQTYTGDGNNNSQTGTADDDTFNYGQGGNDTLNGAGGNDVFNMGAAFTGADTINGGTGNDTLVIDAGPNAGDFISTTSTSLTSVETVRFVGNGHDEYEIYLDDGNMAAGETMTFDTTSFQSTDGIYVNASPETDGNVIYNGGAGGDLFSSSGADNTFMGGGGDDTVDFIATELDDGDFANGAAGNDAFDLIFPNGGDVSLSNNVKNFETLFIYANAAHAFSITTDDSNVAKGQTLTVDMYDHDVPLTFNGSDESDGRFVIYAGTGDDTITGGRGNDVIDAVGGTDTVHGGRGDDVITVNAYVTTDGFLASGIDATDRIDGGAGNDTLIIGSAHDLNEDIFQADTIHNIETIKITEVNLEGPDNFGLWLDDANVAAGKTITIDASSLGQVGDPVRLFLNSNQSDSFVNATGGASDDSLRGGDKGDTLAGAGGNDVLYGLGGADTLDVGTGADVLAYSAVAESKGLKHDTVVGFDAHNDSFQLDLEVQAVANEIIGGQLRQAHFTADLGAALSGLAVGDAVVFAPDSGDDAGNLYLIVNDGTAGYQGNHDYVIQLDGATHLADLYAGNFVFNG